MSEKQLPKFFEIGALRTEMIDNGKGCYLSFRIAPIPVLLHEVTSLEFKLTKDELGQLVDFLTAHLEDQL